MYKFLMYKFLKNKFYKIYYQVIKLFSVKLHQGPGSILIEPLIESLTNMMPKNEFDLIQFQKSVEKPCKDFEGKLLGLGLGVTGPGLDGKKYFHILIRQFFYFFIYFLLFCIYFLSHMIYVRTLMHHSTHPQLHLQARKVSLSVMQ